jgi:hypothetical protein
MNRDELVMDVIDSGYLQKYCSKFLRPWMDREEFEAELYLATVKASRKYLPEKGAWRTFVFWWWRSARSEMTRQYKKRCKWAGMVSFSALEFEVIDRKAETIVSRMAEAAVDRLSNEEKFFLFGSSMKETERRGITRSQYEIRRRQIRRKIAGEL